MAYTVYVACFISVLVAGVSGLTTADCPANIPHDGTLRVHGNFCYTFDVHHSNTYLAAEISCENRGGHLVTVRDADTQAFLVNTLLNEFHYRGIVWIGFTDAKVEGRWEWVDGTPAHYTHWASGQPGIAGELEDCAGMDLAQSTTGEWGDYMCEGFLFLSQEHPFVCEYLATTACPAFTCGLDCGLGGYRIDANGCMLCRCEYSCPAFTCGLDCGQGGYQLDANGCMLCRCEYYVAVATTACPAFTCGLDCGLGGYQIDANGCMQCVCQA